MLQIGSEYAWVWVAIEPVHKQVLAVYVSRHKVISRTQNNVYHRRTTILTLPHYLSSFYRPSPYLPDAERNKRTKKDNDVDLPGIYIDRHPLSDDNAFHRPAL
jgi:hypothetical protein